MYKDKSSDQYVLVGVANTVYTVAPPSEDLVMLGQTQQFGDISFHRKWIETKMTNPKFCALGPDVGNKVEARRCPFQLFVTMCRMVEELSTNVILMIHSFILYTSPTFAGGICSPVPDISKFHVQ